MRSCDFSRQVVTFPGVKMGGVRSDIFPGGESWGNLGNRRESLALLLGRTGYRSRLWVHDPMGGTPMPPVGSLTGRMPVIRGGWGIRLRKSAPLPLGAVVRAGDENPGEIAAFGVNFEVFLFGHPLRFAHHGRAPKGAGESVGYGVREKAINRDVERVVRRPGWCVGGGRLGGRG